MSKEHLGVALALNVPIAVCVTKVSFQKVVHYLHIKHDLYLANSGADIPQIDMTPPNILDQTISMLTKVLKSPGCRRVPVFVNTPQQAVDCARYLAKPLSTATSSSTAGASPTKGTNAAAPASALGHVSGARICPIFMVSNVTGHNLPMLRTFLNVLPSSQSDDKYVVDAPFEFQISDVFSVPFSGTVVSGVITSGVVHGECSAFWGFDACGG